MTRPGKLDANLTHTMHQNLRMFGFNKDNQFFGLENLGWARDADDEEYIWGKFHGSKDDADFVLHMDTTFHETDWEFVALKLKVLAP